MNPNGLQRVTWEEILRQSYIDLPPDFIRYILLKTLKTLIAARTK